MKTIRTWLATITVLLYSLTASAHDFEVDGVFYNVISDKDVEVTYQGDFSINNSNKYRGTIVIPSTVTYSSKVYNVTMIGSHAFSRCIELTSITIPNSVTYIGEYAFFSCDKLVSVNIPENVIEIKSGAFEGCTSLTSVTIPKSVSVIEGNIFAGCNLS